MDLPPISTKSLKNILTSLKNENGSKILTVNEVKNLLDLKLKNGEDLLTMKEIWFVYEVVWLLSQKGYEIAYNFLSLDWEKVLGSYNIRKKMLFENPLMSKQREKFEIDMEIYRNKPDEVVGGEPCKKCGSTSTISVSRQNRSADEMESIKVQCLDCKFRWNAQ